MTSAINSPLIPEVGLLALPYHFWGTRWLTPHHVLTRLANYFHVLWVEPAHHWRGADSLEARKLAGHELVGHLPIGFNRYIPEVWLPDVYRPDALRRALLRARVSRGWRRLEGLGCSTFVLHLWHPDFEASLHGRRPDLSVYHIDDEYSFSSDSPPMGDKEARVLEQVDQVITISPRLLERKSGINPHMALVPEGVDCALYMKAVPEPVDLALIPRPRIGYTGMLKRQLDWTLLKTLAKRHPQWSFVFVGPCTADSKSRDVIDQMKGLENVHFLGEKTVMDLAAYPQHFDVCIMPYVVSEYTNNIYPLKLHEYLASGRPVVSSPIYSLFPFRHLITLATTLDEWSSALADALQVPATTAAAKDARQDVAKQHDWSELIFNIATLIGKRLGPEVAAKLHRIELNVAR